MQYNKIYLLVQSLRAQHLTQKRIAQYTNLSKSTVSRLLTNKQKSVKKETEKKVILSLKQKSKYNKNSKTHKNKYADVLIIRSGFAISKFLEQTNNSYNVMRRSKKLAKEKDIVEVINKKYKKSKKKTELFDYYDMLKAGLIELGMK